MRAALVVVLAVALAGCGGGGEDGPSDTEQVRAIAQSYLTAVADKDWKAACATRSRHDREQLEDGGGCEAVFAKTLGSEDTELFRTARLGAVRIRDDVASVEFSGADSAGKADSLGKLAAVREDGRWLLEDIPEHRLP